MKFHRHLFLLRCLSVIHNSPMSVAFAAIAPWCTRFCAEFMGLWRAPALVITESLGLLGPGFWKQHCRCSQHGNVSEQKPLGKTESRRLWWLFLFVASTKLRKSWQITDIALGEKFRDFCTANSVSNHLRYLLGLVCVWKERCLNSLHNFSCLRSLNEKKQCVKAQTARGKKAAYIQVQGRTGGKRILVFCREQLALSSSHSVVLTLLTQPTQRQTLPKEDFPTKSHTWRHLCTVHRGCSGS